jgi:hypothetical protein
MANGGAIDNAKVWLKTADANMEKGLYTTALYAMEMAVEIALKSLLIELGISVPKLHNIMNALRSTFDERQSSLPKRFREREEFVLSVYNDLLELRSDVGYTFEVHQAVNYEKKALDYIGKTREAVGLCEAAIAHLNRKG